MKPAEASAAGRLVTQKLRALKLELSEAELNLTVAAKALAPRMPRHEAFDAAGAVIEGMGKINYPSTLPPLTKGEAVLVVDVEPPEASRRIHLIGACVGTAINQLTVMACLAPLAESVTTTAGSVYRPAVVDLLKMPTCRLEARRVLVRQLGNQCGRPFADMWEFVNWAKENRPDLDLTSPPVRPDSP